MKNFEALSFLCLFHVYSVSANPKGGLIGKKADSTLTLTTTAKVITKDPKQEQNQFKYDEVKNDLVGLDCDDFYSCGESKTLNKTLCTSVKKIFLLSNQSFSCHQLGVPIFYLPDNDPKSNMIYGFLPMYGSLLENEQKYSSLCHIVKT